MYVEAEGTDAAFHFSVEEYVMRRFRNVMPVVMVWQTDRCAMLGNYQVADAEVNRGCAERESIRIVRRPSGGGTIFTDRGTFLYTVIDDLADPGEREAARTKVVDIVVGILNDLGVPAGMEGRNDILLGGKKISGIAQHAVDGRICTHGSLLYDADLEMLTSALKVDAGKILSKAIPSIRSRVTNIREHMGWDLSSAEFGSLFRERLVERLRPQTYTLTAADLEGVREIYRGKFGNDAWIFERSPQFSFNNSVRFEGGKVEVYLNVVEGRVGSCSIRGDFLGTVPIRGLEELMEKKRFLRGAISDALGETDLSRYLGGVTKEQFLFCMFGDGREGGKPVV